MTQSRSSGGAFSRPVRNFSWKPLLWLFVFLGVMVLSITGAANAATLLYQFDGTAQDERLGQAVSEVGDMDGDGIPDVLISGANKTVVYAGADGSEIRQFPGTNYGAVDGPGDMNGDGVPDVLVGPYSYSGLDGSLIRQYHDPDPANMFSGFGSSVAAVGDLTMDGVSEILIGAPRYPYSSAQGNSLNQGKAHLFNGATGGLMRTFIGLANGAWFGQSVSAAGDVNNDGRPDFMVAAPYFNNNAGYVDVYSGSTLGLFRRFYGSTYARLGTAISGAGDINGDGHDDVIITSLGNDKRLYVYAGASWALLRQIPGQYYSVSGAGDVDGDGWPDFVAGDPYGANDKGLVTVFSGIDASAISVFVGTEEYGKFGQAVSGLSAPSGDIDGDGRDDVAVGAPYSSVGGNSNAGSAYVFSSAEPPQAGPLLKEGSNIIISSETPDAYGGNVTFNPLLGRYAVGYTDLANLRVMGRAIMADGTMPFPSQLISQDQWGVANPGSPDIMPYGSRFIALWHEDGGGSVRRYDLMTAELGSTAGISGSKYWVTQQFDEINQARGELSLNPSGTILATWREESQSRITNQIQDKILGKIGGYAGELDSRPNIQISSPSTGNSDSGGLTAWDPSSDSWLVVWTRRDYNATPDADISMGQRVNVYGLVGLALSPLPAGITDVMANPGGPGWVLMRAEGNNLFATVVNPDGTIGSDIQLTDNTGTDSSPAIAALDDYCLVTWSRLADGNRTIVAQLFDTAFSPLSQIIEVPGYPDLTQNYPRVAANPDDQEFLVTWYQGSPDNRRVYAQRLSVEPNTPAGLDIAVDLGNGVTVVFDEVTAAGTTSATMTGPPSGDFGISFIPILYDISTTAVFSGNVRVEINYDDSTLLPVQEPFLRVYHFTGSPPVPVDITDGSVTPNPDTGTNIITGITDSFSVFGVGIPLTPPAIIIPADVWLECPWDTSPANTGAAIGQAIPGCGNVEITYEDSVVSGCGDTQEITRTWTVTDECGQSVSGTQIIRVEDNDGPSITAPPDVTLECGDGTGPENTGEATALDACGAVSVTYTDAVAAGCGGTGSIVRTWTATDACGNSVSAEQNITVVDTSAPSISIPPNVTLEYPADINPAATGEAVAGDSCSTVTASFSDSFAAGCGGTGTITRTWTAEDLCGNTASGVQTISVVDTTAPVLHGVPENATVGSDSVPDPATVTASDSGDPNPDVLFSEVRTDGSCADNYTLTRTWSAVDACGNSVSATQMISVVDATPPEITVPPNVTLECPADSSPAATGRAVASDDCGEPSITFSDSPASGCGSTETITRTWTATDLAGNSTSADQIITVIDSTAPILDGVPADVTVASGAVPAPGVVTASDGCSGSVTVDFTETRTDGICADDYTLTRTWTATDACGNSTSGVQMVAVIDATPPTIACPADMTVSTDPGSNTAGSVALGTPIVADNCGVADVSSNAPGIFPLGTTTVTWTVTDGSGNSAACGQSVTVVDTEPPTITNPTGNTAGTTGDPKTITAALGDNVGLASATLYYRPIGATGYIGLNFFTGSATVPVANNAVRYILYYITARDGAGNETRAPQTGTYAITVSDDEPPVATGESYGVNEDTPLTVAAPGVLGNDTDNITGITLTAVLGSGPGHGTLSLNPNGSFTYTSALNFNGPDTFTYKANDGVSDSALATVMISVAPVNDAPVLGSIGNQVVDEGEALSFSVSASDPDGTIPALSAGGLPAGTTFTDNSDGTGTFTWVPGSADAGEYSITFAASDGVLSDTQTVTVTVNDAASFRLVSPSNGSALPRKPPATFVWEAGDYNKFYVEFSRFSNFPRFRTLILPVWHKKKHSDTSLTPRKSAWALIRLIEKRGGRVYWRVMAKEKRHQRVYTDTWSFTIQ